MKSFDLLKTIICSESGFDMNAIELSKNRIIYLIFVVAVLHGDIL